MIKDLILALDQEQENYLSDK